MDAILPAAISGETAYFYGLVAGALSCVAFVPYARDTLRGTTRPQRSTWLIWAILASISFATNIAEGASTSLSFIGVQVAWTVLIAILAIWRGKGRWLNPGDVRVLSLAAVGLGLWAMTENAGYALLMSISISAIGALVTVTKSFREPHTETWSTWAASFVAAGFGVLSVGQGDWLIMAYPLYLFGLYSVILMALVLGRAHRQGLQAADIWD